MPPIPQYTWVWVALVGGCLLHLVAVAAVGQPAAAAAEAAVGPAAATASTAAAEQTSPVAFDVLGDVSNASVSVSSEAPAALTTTTSLVLSSSSSLPVVFSTSTDAPTLEVSTERNVTLVSVICRSRPRLFLGFTTTTTTATSPRDDPSPPTTTDAPSPRDDPSLPITTDAPSPPMTTDALSLRGDPSQPTTTDALIPEEDLGLGRGPLVRSAGPGRGVEVALGQLEGEAASQVVVDVEGCGQVALVKGLPAWPLGLTLAIKGTLLLRSSWWVGSHHLKQLSLRVGGGVGGLCTDLPPTLETLDVSHTPVEALVLGAVCAPPRLQRLEAAHAALTRVSLCTPTLITLHLSWNEVGGGLQWAACEGGVAAVQYLEADNNLLTVASTCGWTGLRSMDLRHNLLAGLDLTSCPPANLTTLTAAHNHLVTPPVLPPTLLYLDFSHNHLTSLPVLNHVLMEADFSHNKVVSIGKSRFKRARKLLHLNLAHNHLSALLERDFSGLRSLRTLDVSHNRLRQVAASSLVHLHSLRRLYLQRNHLTSLDAHDLDALQGRAHVLAVLHHNPWECSCYLLSALHQLQTCPGCQHQQRMELECREDGSWVPASAVVRSCLQAIRDDPPMPFDESDEDFSEEEGDDLTGSQAKGHKAVMVVPGVVVVLLVAVTAALGYRLYHRHRRAITTRLAPFCGFCGYCRPDTINNNHQRDRLSQIGNDSDTETEL